MPLAFRRRGVRLAALLLLFSAALSRGADHLVFLEGTPELQAVSGPSAVVRALKRSHAAAWARLSPSLGLPEHAVRHLWVANAVAVELDEAAARRLATEPGVAWVEPVRRLPAPRLPEGRPLPAEDSLEWNLARVKAAEAWSQGLDGSGVVVGHIDTGVDPNHPDLVGKTLAFRDLVAPENQTPRDGLGHGTHTAGTIAGGAASGKAIGIAPGARLVVARVFDGLGTTTEILLSAMEWMLDPDGDETTDDAPRICSNSWGSDSRTDRTFWRAVEAWRRAGIMPVFAAGNAGPEGGTVGIPGAYPQSFAVGATTVDDEVAGFSSRGPITWDGVSMVKPEVSAPGKDVVSALDGGGYRAASGTSMACPLVAGAAALLAQARPGLPIEQLEEALVASARDLGAAGRDNDFGAGVIDVQAALAWLGSEALSLEVLDAEERALPATVTVAGREYRTDENGHLHLRTGAGSHEIAVRRFGYQSWEGTVEVPAGEPAALEVVLSRRPFGVVRGRVRSLQGESVPALLRAPGSGWEGTRSDAAGAFELELPLGSYDLRLFAVGRRPLSVEVVVGEEPTDLDLIMDAAPEVLLVDDDGGADRELRFVEALEARPGGFDLRAAEVGMTLTREELLGYRVVVWLTGEGAGSLDGPAREALHAYLRGGGRLLLTGKGTARALAGTPFLANRLGARLREDGIETDGVYPTGHSSLAERLERADFAGDLGPLTALDPVRPMGFVFLNFDMGVPWKHRGAAVGRRSGGSAAALLAFPLEEIPGAEARSRILGELIDWLASEGDGEHARRASYRKAYE